MKKINKLIIIGSGPAGYTAAIYASRGNLKPTLITGKYEGGQLVKSNNIENWPGEYNGITGFKLMQNMKKQALKFNTNIINDKIYKIYFKKKYIKLKSKKNMYFTKTLIIATGTIPKKLGLNNEKKLYGKGISFCAACDGYFYKKKKIAIIGGSNSALEEALYLSKITKKIYIIHRKNFFTAEKFLIKKIKEKIKKKKIKFYKNKIIIKINKKKNILKSITIKSIKTKKKKKIKIKGLFISIGYKPNTKIFKKKINLNNKGYIITNNNNKYKYMTNIKGVFAAGDVIDEKYKQAIISSSSGCIAALEVQKYLENE